MKQGLSLRVSQHLALTPQLQQSIRLLQLSTLELGQEIQQIIRFLKSRGIGVLITDHNVRETLGICDHAYIINQGTVLAFGKPEEIIYNEDVRKVYLGENFRL